VKKPIQNKPTYYFDTVEGVDHTFNTFRDHADHKWTAKEHEENEKLRRQTKLGIIKDEEKKLKKFDSADARTYPSDPEQKRILTNIKAHEDSLGIRQDTWKRFVKTGSLPLAPKEKQLGTWELMKATGTPEQRREYARMEREGRAQEKKRENLARLEEKRAKIKEFRKKRAEKEKKEEPARAMAQEIVQTVQENANNIINNDPILDDELFTQKPIYAPKVNKEFTGGLHENFVNQKLAENNILKKIDKEIENENI
jgi:hypothetical protein